MRRGRSWRIFSDIGGGCEDCEFCGYDEELVILFGDSDNGVVVRDVCSSGRCGIIPVVRSGDEEDDDNEWGWANEAFLSLEYCVVLCSAD